MQREIDSSVEFKPTGRRRVNLKESDQRLTELCRGFESRAAAEPTLETLVLAVRLVADFTNLPDAKASAVLSGDAAGYLRSERSILISDTSFWQFPEHIRLAVLAHEVGHALCHRDGLMSRKEFAWLSECQVADLFACRWGFHKALRAERDSYYGARYAEALDMWQDENAYISAMGRWRQQYLAGMR